MKEGTTATAKAHAQINTAVPLKIFTKQPRYGERHWSKTGGILDSDFLAVLYVLIQRKLKLSKYIVL